MGSSSSKSVYSNKSVTSRGIKMRRKKDKKFLSLSGHSDSITTLSIDKNNALLLTGSNDHTARVWELSTNECIATLRGHKGYIISVAFEEQADIYAITASSDKTIKRWGPFPLVDLDENYKNEDGEPLQHPHTTIYPHINNSKIQSIKVLGSIVFSASYNSVIVAIDLASGNILRKFEGHRHCVICMHLTSIGSFGENGLRSGKNAINRRHIMNKFNNLDVLTEQNSPLGSVNNLAHDENSGGGHGPGNNNNNNHYIGSNIEAASNLLISGSADWTAKVWDVKNGGECVFTLKGHSGTVMTICVDREELHVFTGSKDSTIRKWNLKSGHCVAVYEGHEKSVTKVLLDYESSVHGAFLYSSSMDGTIKSWTAIHGTNLRTFSTDSTITSFIKFKELLVVFCNDFTLKIFYKDGRKLDEKRLEKTIIREIHSAQNNDLASASKKFQLYGGGSDGAVKIFDMNYWWNKVRPVEDDLNDRYGNGSSHNLNQSDSRIFDGMVQDSGRHTDSDNTDNYSSLGSMWNANLGMASITGGPQNRQRGRKSKARRRPPTIKNNFNNNNNNAETRSDSNPSIYSTNNSQPSSFKSTATRFSSSAGTVATNFSNSSKIALPKSPNLNHKDLRKTISLQNPYQNMQMHLPFPAPVQPQQRRLNLVSPDQQAMDFRLTAPSFRKGGI